MKIGSILFLALFSGAVATTASAADWQGQDNDWQSHDNWQRHDSDWQAHDNNWQERHDENWQGHDSQYACMGDAFSVCGRFIPYRERVAHCLISNRARVSVPCRAALAHWRG